MDDPCNQIKKLANGFISRKVKIPDLERPGVITAVLITNFGVKYCVTYFNEGRQYEEYLYPFQIEIDESGA